MILELLLIALLIILIVVSVIIPVTFLLALMGWTWTGVPYVPLPTHALKRLPDLLALNKDSVLYDLGCGDGRVLYELAKHSDATFIGIEKAPLPYLIAISRSAFSKKKNVKIVFGDIHAVPLTNATHVFTYLLPDVMEKLYPKLKRELASGSKVLSCDFKFAAQEPASIVVEKNTSRPYTLRIYEF